MYTHNDNQRNTFKSPILFIQIEGLFKIVFIDSAKNIRNQIEDEAKQNETKSGFNLLLDVDRFQWFFRFNIE